jgi:soluble lytic murein transglycosylase-like protein
MFNKLILAAIILLLNSGISHASEMVEMRIISKIESNNNPLAVGSSGEIGQYQVMPCVLKEYNKYNNKHYTMSDMKNALRCYTVSFWYINIRIPQMLKYYHKPITVDHILWAYNAGIGNVTKNIKPNSTKNYIRKYHREEVR